MNDLKNCPFCGGKAFLSSALCQTGEADELNAYARNPRCGSCGADIGYCVGALAATTFWNARPAEDRLKAQNAELIKTMEFLLNNNGARGVFHAVNHTQAIRNAEKAIAAARESHE